MYLGLVLIRTFSFKFLLLSCDDALCLQSQGKKKEGLLVTGTKTDGKKVHVHVHAFLHISFFHCWSGSFQKVLIYASVFYLHFQYRVGMMNGYNSMIYIPHYGSESY